MTAYYFVEPLDVLMVRGNKSFGSAGEYGEVVMPPWPSLFAGAFRSSILGKDGERLVRFVAGERLDGSLGDVLGTPDKPGAFRITWVSLARHLSSAATAPGPGSSKGEVDGVMPIIPLPADLVAFAEKEIPSLVPLTPRPLPAGVSAGGCLPLIALLRIPKQVKPVDGQWLDEAGLAAHIAGSVPKTTLNGGNVFKRETRLGIALDTQTRTATEGALYTTDAIAFRKGGGFLVGIDGADGVLQESGFLRLGGDGKGARYRRVPYEPSPAPLEAIDRSKCFRLILSTPGVFSGGWVPERVTKEGDPYRLQGEGFSARLACAAVPRHETISGWDLAKWQPKTAQRVAPAGSVYWFDEFEGDVGKLAGWVDGGLWGDDECMSNADKSRRAEGFNQAMLAAWLLMR